MSTAVVLAHTPLYSEVLSNSSGSSGEDDLDILTALLSESEAVSVEERGADEGPDDFDRLFDGDGEEEEGEGDGDGDDSHLCGEGGEEEERDAEGKMEAKSREDLEGWCYRCLWLALSPPLSPHRTPTPPPLPPPTSAESVICLLLQRS